MNFFLKHNILKILFIDIHKFKKKKILEEDEDESNDQQSDDEQTGNEGNVNDTYLIFFNVPETAQSQVKATLDQKGALLESQTYQQAGSHPNK